MSDSELRAMTLTLLTPPPTPQPSPLEAPLSAPAMELL